MAEQFLHGIEIIEQSDGLRPIQTVKSSVIGLVVTAPDADETVFPLNEPVLILSDPRKAAKLDTTGNGLGTAKDAIDAIYDQDGAAVVVVRVADGDDIFETWSNILGDQTAKTGVWALLTSKAKNGYTPKLITVPGYMGQRIEGAVTVINVVSGGSGYTSPPTVVITPASGDHGVGAQAEAVVVAGAVTQVKIKRSGFNYGSAPTISFTGGGGSGATATATIGNAANPVVAELQGIADRLRAIILVDGPNSTDEAAVIYRNDWGNKRIYITDPWPLVFDTDLSTVVAQPPSPRVAGMISRMDRERGFWWSPSNQIMYGVIGTARPVDFNISDPNSQANYLNEHEVSTIVREDGFRLWGNRTTASDPLWAFLPVRRTADMVYESIERAFLWALDRPLTANNILEIAESVNEYLRSLIARGAIIGGKCFIDPSLNTPTVLQSGKLFVSFDIEPPAPLEHLIFHAHRNGQYYEEVIERVVRDLAA